MALSEVMDPMFWLGEQGPFASAVLAGIMVIVFVETGLLFPFLPGDTLLFTAGLIAAQPHSAVDLWSVGPCAAVAATAGGQVGYWLGRRIGPALFAKPDARFFKQRYLTDSHAFFERHGSQALLLAPFIGVVRTFLPVVAGVAGMPYRKFVLFNAIGAALWGIGLTTVGYFLGNVGAVARHLELMVVAIAVLSTLPVLITAARATLTARSRRAP